MFEGYPPKKLTWQWKIHHEWRCISYWTWGFSSQSFVCFRGVVILWPTFFAVELQGPFTCWVHQCPNRIHPWKLTAGTPKWRWMEDDFPFHFGVIFRFQPLVLRGGGGYQSFCFPIFFIVHLDISTITAPKTSWEPFLGTSDRWSPNIPEHSPLWV